MKISWTPNMNDRQRLLLLILILAVVAFFTTGVTNYLLYNAAFEQNRARLLVSAQSQARMMDAVALFDQKHRTNYPKGPTAATISQILDAHERFENWGETAEFVLARREEDQIVFLFRQRHHDHEIPKPVPFDSDLAEPVRRALSGKSGTMVGLDHHGGMVLAAYEPVAVLNFGIVAKIDMAEIRAPFVKTGIITGILALLTILAGAFLFVRTTNPMFRRIQKSEVKYRDLVETSQDLIWRADREGRFTYLNPAWESTLGYSLDEMIGHPFPDFKRPVEREQNLQRHRRIMQEEVPTNFETTYISKTGEEVILIFKAKPLLDGSGQVVGTQGTATDITERKRAEVELSRHKDQLERIVEERTKELKEAQNMFFRREKLAALGQLAGGVGHDFNNVLTPIIGFSELLMDQFSTDSQEYSHLKVILGSAKRAADLVSQILIFGRESEEKKVECQLNSIVDEVVKLIRVTLPVTITIHERIEDANLVLADATQMHQVLMNLCINAGQAMPEGGELEISLENVELDNVACYLGEGLSGPHVRISVADTGVGMDENTLAHLFEPFFTTKDVGKGTGLGLSTVLGIVVKHGGGICVSSQPGKGSTFEVLLPAVETAEGEPIVSQIPDLGGTESILFVDDEETITHLGREMLQRMGYRVAALTSSMEALELFKADPDRFDLVITDQTMPDLTGANLSQQLREIRHDIPIILCTGFSDTVTRDVANDLGINEFVYKPLGKKELGRTVRKVLGNGK